MANDQWEQGRLFELRAGRDYLTTLGYRAAEGLSLPGRQIDLIAPHVIENRVAVAECKATGQRVGGKALNLFSGKAMQGGSQLDGRSVQPYFLSVAGFTAEARELEAKRLPSRNRSILVDGSDIVHQLVRGNLVVGFDTATEAAGRAIATARCDVVSDDLRLLGGELLVWELGYVWAVYFSETQFPTHGVYVHGDGDRLAPQLQELMVLRDQNGPRVHFVPAASAADSKLQRAAMVAYFHYINQEFSVVTTEGIPSDIHSGSQKLQLEKILVPQRVQAAESPKGPPDALGSMLARSPRLAVLAMPGGGKSTLIKRLATAYAFPDRRDAVDDQLPNKPYLPLILRCRELRHHADAPFRDTLRKIPENGEFVEHSHGFGLLVRDAIQTGDALILIDGLDEISDETERRRFVERVRLFLAAYPTVAAVMTARPAGFRIVAGAVADMCMQVRICELSPAEIRIFCRVWLENVKGTSDVVDREADDVADRILGNERLHRLAAVPLLLTTLLLVKRGVGTLPDKRAALYEKALEVLLATWNVEGHAPIDVDEAIPQLAWVAYAMTAVGEQQIGEQELIDQLRSARNTMSEIFGRGTMGLGSFIKQIEDRSSLLHLVGRVERAGREERLYEFKHLTFQEYLTARGLANRFCEPTATEDRLIETLQNRFGDPTWREVIPLVAVLKGRDAGPLIEAMSSAAVQRDDASAGVTAEVIAQCLIDGVQLRPDVAKSACRALALARRWNRREQLRDLLASAYGATLRAAIDEGFCTDEQNFLRFGDFITDVVAIDGNPQTIYWHILTVFKAFCDDQPSNLVFDADADQFVPLLDDARPHLQISGCRGLTIAGMLGRLTPKQTEGSYMRLVDLWTSHRVPAIRTAAAQALSTMHLLRARFRTPLREYPGLGIRELELQLTGISQQVDRDARCGAAISVLYLRGDSRYDLADFRAMLNERIHDGRYPWLKVLMHRLSREP